MKIYVDGEPLVLDFSAEATFGSIFEEVEDELGRKNRVVSSFAINNEVLTQEVEELLWDERPDVDIRIDVETKDALEILSGALGEAEKDLSQLTESMHKAAVSLQTGLKQEAYAVFQQCLDTWRQVINLLQIAQHVLQYRPEEVEVEGRNINQINEELARALTETKEAMETDNLINISDMIEYELCRKVEEEKQIIARLIGYADERSGRNRL